MLPTRREILKSSAAVTAAAGLLTSGTLSLPQTLRSCCAYGMTGKRHGIHGAWRGGK